MFFFFTAIHKLLCEKSPFVIMLILTQLLRAFLVEDQNAQKKNW